MSARTQRRGVDKPVPLTVLCGLDGQKVADIGAGLLLRASRLALIWVDPARAEQGSVACRVTDSDGRCTTQMFELGHDCLSCTMRETVATAVRRLRRTGRYDSILLHLHPGIEASAAVQALEIELLGEAVIDTVVLALDADWLEQLAGDADVSVHGVAVVPDDDRSLAQVLAADLDVANVLVLGGAPAHGNAIESHAALGALSPDSRRIYPPTVLDVALEDVLRTRSFDSAVLDPVTRGGLLSPTSALVSSRTELGLVRWRSALPLHPQRLYDALEDLADGVIRSAGRLWFANHPELLIGWDSAGDRLALGPEGVWPDPALAMPQQVRVAGRPSPGPQAVPGARENVLALLGTGLDAERLRGVLDGCVLTPAELAGGPAAWRALPDPFPEWHVADDPDHEEGAA